MKTVSARERTALIRLSAALPKGDEARVALLTTLSSPLEVRQAATATQKWKAVDGPREGEVVTVSWKVDPAQDDDEQFVRAFQKKTKLRMENGAAGEPVLSTTDGSEWELQEE